MSIDKEFLAEESGQDESLVENSFPQLSQRKPKMIKTVDSASDFIVSQFQELSFLIEKRLYNEPTPDEPKEDFLRSYSREYSSLQAVVYCYSKDALLVGGLHLVGGFFNNIVLENFVVSEFYSQQGFGQKIMDEAIEHCRFKEYDSIQLSVDESDKYVVDFYKKNGFVVCGTVKDDGFNLTNMELKL